MPTVSCHSGHRQRLRQRALQSRLEHMSPHEVLEFLLTYTIPLRDVNALAHALIGRFGSLGHVLRAPVLLLTQVSGVGQHTAEFLHLVGQSLQEYHSVSAVDPPLYDRATHLGALLTRELQTDGYYVVCMDPHAHLLGIRLLQPPLYTPLSLARLMIQYALQLQAYNVVLVRRGAESFSLLEYSALEEFDRIAEDISLRCLDALLLCSSGRILSLKASGRQASPGRLQESDRDPLAASDFTLHWLDNLPAT